MKELPYKPSREIPRHTTEHIDACQYSKCERYDDEYNSVTWQSYKWVVAQLTYWPGDPQIRSRYGPLKWCSVEHLIEWARENTESTAGERGE